MKKLKIGIPKALTYYENEILLKSFLNNLNCQIIISNQQSQKNEENITNVKRNECCLPYKKYIESVISLAEKCDYIIITSISGKNITNQSCAYLTNSYNRIKELISKDQIIEHNIKYSNNRKEVLSYLKLGFRINHNPIRIIISYLKAKKKQTNHQKAKYSEIKHKLSQDNTKILVISHKYIINNHEISSILKEMEKNKSIIIIDANNVDAKTAIEYSLFFSDKIKWYESKRLIGALYYLMPQIDGVIYIKSPNCCQDEITYELSTKMNASIPSIIVEINNYDTIIKAINQFINKITGEKYEK